jgi:hypothetical protein
MANAPISQQTINQRHDGNIFFMASLATPAPECLPTEILGFRMGRGEWPMRLVNKQLTNTVKE